MSVLKLDVDFKMDKELLRKFVDTRFAILKHLGYHVVEIKAVETKRGYHFWVHLSENLNARERCELQFLLGDDINRVKYNFLRLNAKCFDEFNALFSVKVKRNSKWLAKVRWFKGL